MAEAKLSRLQSSCWFAVVETYQECNRRYATMLREFDLTVPQFDVLSAIHGLGENAIPKRIAEKMLVTRGNVTGLLTRLQDRRLIRTREAAADGRSFICELTAKGQRLLQAARSGASLFIQEQLQPFDEAETRDIEALMLRMRSHLQTLDPLEIAHRAKRRKIAA